MDDAKQAALEGQAGAARVTGYCQDCGAWTVGEFVRAIPGNSGPGADVVTHDLGACPGPRRRR